MAISDKSNEVMLIVSEKLRTRILLFMSKLKLSKAGPVRSNRTKSAGNVFVANPGLP